MVYNSVDYVNCTAQFDIHAYLTQSIEMFVAKCMIHLETYVKRRVELSCFWTSFLRLAPIREHTAAILIGLSLTSIECDW